MIKIAVVCPEPLDGTAHYRATSPFNALSRVREDIRYEVFRDPPTYNELLTFDILFLQRPAMEQHLQCARFAKALGMPIWIDYDDAYMDVPVHNGRFFLYAAQNVKATIIELAKMATIVTVSTLDLRNDFVRYNKNTAVVMNGLDTKHAKRPARDESTLPIRRVFWRGGDSHSDDLEKFSDAILGAANQADAPHHYWTFFGFNPHWMLRKFPAQSLQVVPWSTMGDYFRHMPSLKPTIGITPLADTHFNRCKSNIAMLEQAWAGAACLVPYWPGWVAPGTLTYETPADFQTQLVRMMKMPTNELQARNEKTWAHILEARLVTYMNEMREKIVDALMASDSAVEKVVA